MQEKIKKRKSNAKAMGLKSALILDNKVVVTSFAEKKDEQKGKTANIEKITDFAGKEVKDTNIKATPIMFETYVNELKIELENKRRNGIDFAIIPNPAKADIGRDYVGIKENLEKMIFNGQTFPNDNIHIQIAYNVLDISKIFESYTSAIVQLFYNLNRGANATNEEIDIIGIMPFFNSYKKQKELAFNNDENVFKNKKIFGEINNLLKNTVAYHIYFDDVFESCNNKNDKNQQYNMRVHNYDVIRMVSFLRQFLVHSQLKVKDGGNIDSEYILFNDEKFLNNNARDLIYRFNEFIQKGIDRINQAFTVGIKNDQNQQRSIAKNNLFILSKIYSNFSFDELVKKYYEFSIKKQQKNIGINLIKLREVLVNDYYFNLFDKKYDTCRSKLYTILNFVIYEKIQKDENIVSSMIDELRINQEGEDGKYKIYKVYSKQIFQCYRNDFDKAIKIFEEEMRNKFKSGKDLKIELKPDYKISANNFNFLCKILFFISKFLDGKEVNELYSSLINKFDNIQDLLETAKNCNLEIKFSNDYDILTKSRDIANQIRVLKDISKTKMEPSKLCKNQLIRDAYDILGLPKEKYDEQLEDKFHKDKNTKLRNFISTNVLKNKRFLYIVKYCNPKTCAKLTKNRNLVELALKEMPDSQIYRYYFLLTGKNEELDSTVLKSKIIGMLTNFNIEKINNIVENLSKEENKTIDGSLKGQMRSLVTLYLTVIYLIIKNIIKINSSFALAFATLDRDHKLIYNRESVDDLYKKIYNNQNNVYLQTSNNLSYCKLTASFLEKDKQIEEKLKKLPKIEKSFSIQMKKHIRNEKKKLIKQLHYNKHAYEYLTKNLNFIINNKFEESIRYFRNNVAHLTIVKDLPKYVQKMKTTDSYYSCYCYVLETIICEKMKYIKCIEKLKTGTYSSDMMKILCMPFAYNLARYKHLSIEDLFINLRK